MEELGKGFKWKYEHETCILRKSLEDLEKKMRLRRKDIGDGIVVPQQIKGQSGVDKKIIYEEACLVDEELQSLIVVQKVLEEKMDAWNTLMSLGIYKISRDLLDTFYSEYEEDESKRYINAVKKLFIYDNTKRTYKQI